MVRAQTTHPKWHYLKYWTRYSLDTRMAPWFFKFHIKTNRLDAFLKICGRRSHIIVWRNDVTRWCDDVTELWLTSAHMQFMQVCTTPRALSSWLNRVKHVSTRTSKTKVRACAKVEQTHKMIFFLKKWLKNKKQLSHCKAPRDETISFNALGSYVSSLSFRQTVPPNTHMMWSNDAITLYETI